MLVSRSRIRIPDHLSTFLTIAENGILGDLLAVLIQSPASFHDTHQNDWFGCDLADIWFPMSIIRDSNPGSLLLESLAEVCALWTQSSFFFVLVYILCVFCIFPLGYVSFVVIISAVDCSCLKRYVSKMTYQCGKLTRAHWLIVSAFSSAS